jgi:hypothetical protein
LQARAGADGGKRGHTADAARREGIDHNRGCTRCGGFLSHVFDEWARTAAAVQHDDDGRSRVSAFRVAHDVVRLKPCDTLVDSFRERLNRHEQSQRNQRESQDVGPGDRRARPALSAPLHQIVLGVPQYVHDDR